MITEILGEIFGRLSHAQNALETMKSNLDTPEELAGWTLVIGLPVLTLATCYSLRRLYQETKPLSVLVERRFHPRGLEVQDIAEDLEENRYRTTSEYS